MKTVFIIFGILLGYFGMMTPGSEIIWIPFVLFCILSSLCSSWEWRHRLAGAAAGIVVLVAHFAGFKIFGYEATYYNGAVLDSPLQLSSLAEPNILVATDGTRVEVKGVKFQRNTVLLFTEGDPHFRTQELKRIFNQSSNQPLLIEIDPSAPSGVVFQKRYQGSMSCTLSGPSILPVPQPRYSRADVGEHMVRYGAATPNPP